MAELAQLPGELDLRIYRGDDTNFQVTITDTATGDPLALPTTGWRSQARTDTDSDVVLFAVTIDGADAGTGVLGVHIDGTATAPVAESKIAWDLENTELDRTYLAGSIYLKGQVSR
jgi:hypothetical protein